MRMTIVPDRPPRVPYLIIQGSTVRKARMRVRLLNAALVASTRKSTSRSR